MIISPFGPFLMAPSNARLPPGIAYKWRLLLTNSSLVGYWDFEAAVQQGMFEDTNCAGPDHAIGLVAVDRGSADLDPGTCGFEEPDGTGLSTAVVNTDPFSHSPRTMNAALYQGSHLTANSCAFVMHFPSPVQINSILLYDVNMVRQPTAMALQYWDGAAWATKATLTKGGATDTVMYWRSITLGGSVASTTS